MIKLNDNYHIDRDRLNWILVEKKYRKAKSGKHAGEIVCEDTHHYFGKLEQLCHRVLDMELDPDGGMENLLASVHGAQNMIVKAIEKHSREVKAMVEEGVFK